MTVCSVDFETYATVELKRTGVYPYAKHHDTGIWCMAWAFDDEEPELWREGDPFPKRIREHLAGRGEMRAWNAAFERILWRDCAVSRYGFPRVLSEQWFCTMAEACAMSLPRSLEHAAEVLRVPFKKDMVGNRLSKQMCRPRRFSDDGKPVWWDDEVRRAKLYDYCQQDVRVERAVSKLVRRLGERERRLYLLDQKMNDRGVALDLPLVTKAREIAEREIEKQNARLAEATDGAVTTVTKVAKLKRWLKEQGVEAESLAKKALDELLDDSAQLSADVRNALESRAEAAKSSVAKLDAMLDCVGRDNRMRGLMLYHGASTGRWTGKLVQPHNFPRGLDVKDVEQHIPTVLEGDPGNAITLQIISAMLRPMMAAGPGMQLTAADFAAIEARVLAWVSNETLMLQQFREGRPIYKEMAGVIYGRPASEIVKPSPEYQIGKNTVLGCGFQMGYKKFAATTGVEEQLAMAAVQSYRSMYPMIPMYWDKVNQAAINAVNDPGTPDKPKVYRVGHCQFTRRGGYLWIVLPAGRSLAYATPKIVDRPMPWDAKDLRPAVEYSGVNSYSRKWERMALYGGLLTENIVQAIARDLLADSMLRVDDAGFPVILCVHDEIVTESPQAEHTHAQVLDLMKQVPAWATGCPIDAEGWAGCRYRK